MEEEKDRLATEISEEKAADSPQASGAEETLAEGNDKNTANSDEESKAFGREEKPENPRAKVQETGTEEQEPKTSETKPKKTESKQQKTSSRVRMLLGVVIMLVGIGICLYPFYRQKKSDNFNEDAINMILTPQPTQAEAQTPPMPEAGADLTPQGTQMAAASPDDSDDGEISGEPGKADEGEEPEADLRMLGGDLLENPDAPEQDAEDEKENANRLNGQKVIGVIQIPKIELIYAIVEGSDAAEIGVAIGHMSSTAQLGEIGNCALAGHRGGYSGPYFKNLDKLEIGDEVIITNAKHEVFTYKVTETMIVQPDEVWVIEDTGEGVAMLTLVTCENSGTERLIVRCVAK